jgi:hypothetical protein
MESSSGRELKEQIYFIDIDGRDGIHKMKKEYGELLIMLANGRQDLNRRLKG